MFFLNLFKKQTDYFKRQTGVISGGQPSKAFYSITKRSVYRGLIFGFFSLYLSACADLKMAELALEQGKLKEAESQWQELAQRGFPEASYQLGKLYLNKPDYLAAKDALEQAYQGNVKPAALELAKLYENQSFSEYDPEQAAKWYRIAGDSGYPGARLKLADLYLSGRGVSKDNKQAFSLYDALIRENYLPVFYRLGVIYETGEAGSPQPQLAEKWYLRAVLKGHAGAKFRLAGMYAEGRGVQKNLRQAIQYYQDITQGPQVPEKKGLAAFRLGRIYEQADFEDRNLEKAAKWYRMASLQGHFAAQLSLADFYWRGEGLPQDRIKGLKLYEALVKKQYVPAMYRLAYIYETGEGVPSQPLKAVAWYQKAAETGHINARYRLALIYLYGEAPLQNKEKGLGLLIGLADQDYIPAYYRLGRYYESQTHLKEHLLQAEPWYHRAAEKDHFQSKYRLALLVIRGQLTTINVNAAIELLSREVEKGNGEIAFEIGAYFEKKRNNIGDFDRAIHWYKKSIALGYLSAAYHLGNLHVLNDNVKQAAFYLQLAADSDYLPAVYKLAQLYENQSKGEDQHLRSAIKWYRNAARAGHLSAQGKLWELLSDSDDRDEQKEAVDWLKRAADAGDPKALMDYGVANVEAFLIPQDKVKGLSYLLAAARKMKRGAVKRALVVMGELPPEQIRRANAAAKKLITP